MPIESRKSFALRAWTPAVPPPLGPLAPPEVLAALPAANVRAAVDAPAAPEDVLPVPELGAPVLAAAAALLAALGVARPVLAPVAIPALAPTEAPPPMEVRASVETPLTQPAAAAQSALTRHGQGSRRPPAHGREATDDQASTSAPRLYTEGAGRCATKGAGRPEAPALSFACTMPRFELWESIDGTEVALAAPDDPGYAALIRDAGGRPMRHLRDFDAASWAEAATLMNAHFGWGETTLVPVI